MSVMVREQLSTDAISITEARIAMRKAAVKKIVEEYSVRMFGHRRASIKEIRLEAVKRNLEMAFKIS